MRLNSFGILEKSKQEASGFVAQQTASNITSHRDLI